jgi:hypothetical protein
MHHRQVTRLSGVSKVGIIGHDLRRGELTLVDDDPRAEAGDVLHVPLFERLLLQAMKGLLAD